MAAGLSCGISPMNPVHPTDQELKQAYQVIKGDQIPSIPDILLSIYTELEKPDPNTRHVSELVAQDQAITGKVLKAVNSPKFGLKQPVESISQAVVLLGLAQIRNLVTAATFQNQVKAQSPGARQIWHDSLNVAQVGLQIAYHVEGISQDEAYLLGLLHDCGALLLSEKFPLYEQIHTLENEYPVGLINKEIQHMGTNHTIIGYLFASHWKLPEPICQAIYLHHTLSCEGIENDRVRALIATLKIAHALVKERSLPESAFSLERVQYLAYAKQELMLDDELLDELRTEAVLELD